MAVVYSASLKNTRMASVLTAIDAGASAGEIRLGTASMASILAVIPLADPAGSVTGDTLNFTMPQSDASADNSGTAVEADIRDSDGNVIVSGLTVGTSGTNIILNNNVLTAGQQVTMNSASIQHG